MVGKRVETWQILSLRQASQLTISLLLARGLICLTRAPWLQLPSWHSKQFALLNRLIQLDSSNLCILFIVITFFFLSYPALKNQ